MSEDTMKDKLDAKLAAKAAEIEKAKPVVEVRDTDPELTAALAKVARGELAAAYRTRNGSLVITHRSDPANSPAAPEAPNANGR